MVRAKFKCDEKIKQEAPYTVGYTVVFSVITNEPKLKDDGTTYWDVPEENAEFFRLTPSGQLRMGILNEAAADYFEVGKSYYLDFTKVD